MFAIIPIEGVPQKVIKNYEFKARITKPNRAFKKMLESYMNDLNWNVDSFSKVNADFILSNADYYPSFYMVLLWIVLVIFSYFHEKNLSVV